MRKDLQLQDDNYSSSSSTTTDESDDHSVDLLPSTSMRKQHDAALTPSPKKRPRGFACNEEAPTTPATQTLNDLTFIDGQHGVADLHFNVLHRSSQPTDKTDYEHIRHETSAKQRKMKERGSKSKLCSNAGSSNKKTEKRNHAALLEDARDNKSTLKKSTQNDNWIAAPNPWGDHQCDGDFVLLSPRDYQKAQTIHGRMAKRFTMNPFESEASPYYQSHTPPSDGHSVVVLMRDRLSLRSWGFSFCLHENGGACLIDDIEPMSPAQSAVQLGFETARKQHFCGIERNDMILCVNGRKVGGMSLLDLEIELNTCGNQVILILSKYRQVKISHERCSESKDRSDHMKGDVEDVEEDDNDDTEWDLVHIFSVEELKSSSPKLCMTEGCPLVACSTYVSSVGREVWHSCLDCQEKDYCGWPDQIKEFPIKFMSSDHRSIIREKCSRQCAPQMPMLPLRLDSNESHQEKEGSCS